METSTWNNVTGPTTEIYFVSIENNTNVGSPLSPGAYLSICVAAALCSAVTVCGNLLVILSFIVNRTMRNFSNYLILNLAISDIIIGLFSMNVATVYNVNGNRWILGNGMCLTWLTVDYVASNTSVMNLLAICIDRYMAISNPVKYRQRTKANVAVMVMVSVWIISFLVWGPAILLWQFISPKDTIREYECYIPFVDNNPSITIITAVAAFYAPTTAMCILYWRVIVKIKRRGSNVAKLVTHATEAMSTKYVSPWKRASRYKRKVAKETCGGAEGKYRPTVDSPADDASSSDKVDYYLSNERKKSMQAARIKLSEAFNHMESNRHSSHTENSNKSSTSLLKKDPSAEGCSSNTSEKKTLYVNADISSNYESHSSTEGNNKKTDPELTLTNNNNLDKGLTDHGEVVNNTVSLSNRKALHEIDGNKNNKQSLNADAAAVAQLLKSTCDNVKLSTAAVSRRLRREHRATRLLKGILICFIVLWLPYNLAVIVSSVCTKCAVSATVWNLGYWLCYLNSTVNPFCYGFCNDNFKRTFKALLTTKWWTHAGRRKLRSQVSTKSLHQKSNRKFN